MTDKEEFLARFPVSRETSDRLETYAALLRKWSPSINLVAPSTLPDLWSRHFIDSAQLFERVPETATTWIDLGSGGGFPGLVIAILAAELRPGLHVTLVESDTRKCVFLRTVARETGVDVTVLTERIERLPPGAHDVVSARALSALPKLLEYAVPLLAPGGMCLFPKGEKAESELTAARENWHIRVEQFPSLTDASARLLSITEVRRAH